MTQHEAIIKYFAVLDVSDPGAPLIACQFHVDGIPGICGRHFEPDLTFKEAWQHLRLQHQEVSGDIEYHGPRPADIIAFSIKRASEYPTTNDA